MSELSDWKRWCYEPEKAAWEEKMKAADDERRLLRKGLEASNEIMATILRVATLDPLEDLTFDEIQARIHENRTLIGVTA
jgi:hypothetical protein